MRARECAPCTPIPFYRHTNFSRGSLTRGECWVTKARGLGPCLRACKSLPLVCKPYTLKSHPVLLVCVDVSPAVRGAGTRGMHSAANM